MKHGGKLLQEIVYASSCGILFLSSFLGLSLFTAIVYDKL